MSSLFSLFVRHSVSLPFSGSTSSFQSIESNSKSGRPINKESITCDLKIPPTKK